MSEHLITGTPIVESVNPKPQALNSIYLCIRLRSLLFSAQVDLKSCLGLKGLEPRVRNSGKSGSA